MSNSSQVENAGRSTKLSVIAVPAACIIMRLFQARDERFGQDARIAFSPPEIDTVDTFLPEFEGKTALQKKPYPPKSIAAVFSGG